MEFVPPITKSDRAIGSVFRTTQPIVNAGGFDTDIDLVHTDHRNAPYTESWCFYNYTSSAVYVTDRLGLRTMLAPRAHHGRNDVVMFRIFRLHGDSIESFISSVQNDNNLHSCEVQELRNVIHRSIKNNPHQRDLHVALEYRLGLADITSRGGVIYHYQSDRLFATSARDDAVHPYSPRSIDVTGFARTDFMQDDGLIMKVRYISHDENATPLYLNVLGQVFRLQPERTAPARAVGLRKKGGGAKSVTVTYQDYISVTYRAKGTDAKASDDEFLTVTYSIEEAKTVFGVFETVAEAKNFGDPESMHKSKQLAMQHELEHLKQTTLVQKESFAAAEQSREAERKSLEHTNALLQAQNQEIRQRAETQTHENTLALAKAKQAEAEAKQNLVILESAMKREA